MSVPKIQFCKGLFIAEGSSDAPLGDLVEALFRERGVSLSLTRPDFDRLNARIGRDIASKLTAAISLSAGDMDVVVVHRDADTKGAGARRDEIYNAVRDVGYESHVVPVVPIRMTEAWLLLDESSIRTVAGNPNGRMSLGLPSAKEAERMSDPKAYLSQVLLEAASVTGRRRKRLAARFDNNRRQLLERLDPLGPVSALSAWKAMVADIETAAAALS